MECLYLRICLQLRFEFGEDLAAGFRGLDELMPEVEDGVEELVEGVRVLSELFWTRTGVALRGRPLSAMFVASMSKMVSSGAPELCSSRLFLTC